MYQHRPFRKYRVKEERLEALVRADLDPIDSSSYLLPDNTHAIVGSIGDLRASDPLHTLLAWVEPISGT
jgi:hypothetical protein